MFKSRYEHTTPLFNRLKLLNFDNIVKYMSLLFVFKSIQSEGPLFTRYPENNYNTRATTMSLLQMPNIFINSFQAGRQVDRGGAVEQGSLQISGRLRIAPYSKSE